MRREFTVKGLDFVIANYRARNNEYEKGLKYQLLIKVYTSPIWYQKNDPEFYYNNYEYKDTGHRFTTMKECKQYATENYYIWL